MVVTNNRDLVKRIRQFRSHGLTRDPDDFVNTDLAFEGNHSDTANHNSANPWYYEQTELRSTTVLPISNVPLAGLK